MGDPSTWCICLAFFFSFWFIFLLGSSLLTLCVFFFCVIVRDHPKLESRFEERVWTAVEYVSTIDNFDDIVDPQALARHFLGPEPSHYILNAIHHEERSESFWRKLIAYISSSFLLFLSFSFFFLTSLLFLFSFAEMTTKFNQEFYAQIKAKKNEPLSSIGQRRLRVVEKEKKKRCQKKARPPLPWTRVELLLWPRLSRR